MIHKHSISNAGFTLVELLVSVSIFALMTALLVSKYGTFNQGILLTNLAYDVALTLRTAQSYGLNVKSASPTGNEFNLPYGVHFSKKSPLQILFFSDGNQNGTYDNGEYTISTYNIKRGSRVKDVCASNGHSQCTNSGDTLDIVFRRPDPTAFIKQGNNSHDVRAEILLESSDGGRKKVIVNKTGQIAVSD